VVQSETFNDADTPSAVASRVRDREGENYKEVIRYVVLNPVRAQIVARPGGNERRPIFHDDDDRNAFLRFLGEGATRFGWNISAWVLMTNHFHLVIQTPNEDLSRGMHWINGSYAGWFNRRHQRWGHLFGGRFKAFVIEKENYYKEVIRYVVLNPVRAEIVARPEEYAWSSYRATAGFASAPSWFDAEAALMPFAEDRFVAETFYREFVEQKVNAPDCLWQKLVNGIYLGTDRWTKKMRRVLESKRRSTEHPKKQRAVGRPAMKEIVAAVTRVDARKTSDFGPDHRRRLRRVIAWLGWNEGVLRLRDIAASLGLRSIGYVSNLIRRCKRELTSEAALVGFVESVLLLLA
jgi:putative transposase